MPRHRAFTVAIVLVAKHRRPATGGCQEAPDVERQPDKSRNTVGNRRAAGHSMRNCKCRWSPAAARCRKRFVNRWRLVNGPDIRVGSSELSTVGKSVCKALPAAPNWLRALHCRSDDSTDSPVEIYESYHVEPASPRSCRECEAHNFRPVPVEPKSGLLTLKER